MPPPPTHKTIFNHSITRIRSREHAEVLGLLGQLVEQASVSHLRTPHMKILGESLALQPLPGTHPAVYKSDSKTTGVHFTFFAGVGAALRAAGESSAHCGSICTTRTDCLTFTYA